MSTAKYDNAISLSSKAAQQGKDFTSSSKIQVDKKQQSSQNVVKPKNPQKETGSGTTTNKQSNIKNLKNEKDKANKNEKDEPEANTWPPFNFDGSHALKSRLVLNVRSCNYDLFRTVALEELNWKIVDHLNRVWEPVSHNP